MAKVLMIVAQKGFRDEELLVPKEILSINHIVKVASLTRSEAVGSLGAKIIPDLAVFEANPEFFDAVIIVGGPGSPDLAKNELVTSFVSKAFSKGKIIGGICLGPMTLANAGILFGKKATVFKSRIGIDALRNGGSEYKDVHLIIDGNIITADSPQSAGEFAQTIKKKLEGYNDNH